MPGRVVSAAPHAPPAGSPARRSAPRCPSRDHARGPDREAPPLRRGYSQCLSPDRRNERTPSDAVRLRRAAIRPAYPRGSRGARRQMLRQSCRSSSSFQCPSHKKSRAVKRRFASARGDRTQLRDLLCLYPSMSWSTKTFRAPGGSLAIASARSILSMCIGARANSVHRSSPTSLSSVLEASLPSVFLAFKTTLTARRCSQVEKALSPLNCGSFSQVLTNTSCVSSSPLVLLPLIRVHSEYTLLACDRYSRSNAWRSPAAAKATSVESPIGTGTTLEPPAIRSLSGLCCKIG